MDHVETALHRTKGDALILELGFHGGHWRFDNEIRKAIDDAVRASAPAGILLDLSEFRYRGGDYASGFLAAFLDTEHRRVRPACFVRAPRGVRNLFEVIDIGGKLAIRNFDGRAEAIEYLSARLESTG